MKERGLGIAPPPFKTAMERYGFWPLTVWPINMRDPLTQFLKGAIGDGCEARVGSGKQGYRKMISKKSARKGCFANTDLSKTLYKITESIFNPIVAVKIINMYAPKDGTVYDPFAGGGTRAMAACGAHLKYVGVELREEEVQSILKRAEALSISSPIFFGDKTETSFLN